MGYWSSKETVGSLSKNPSRRSFDEGGYWERGLGESIVRTLRSPSPVKTLGVGGREVSRLKIVQDGRVVESLKRWWVPRHRHKTGYFWPNVRTSLLPVRNPLNKIGTHIFEYEFCTGSYLPIKVSGIRNSVQYPG